MQQTNKGFFQELNKKLKKDCVEVLKLGENTPTLGDLVLLKKGSAAQREVI